MTYIDFRNEFFNQACFNSNQVFAWYPGFDKNNFGRWVKKGYLVKLKNGSYSFKEQSNLPNFNLFIANRIYRPSYVSLHTALSFYGLIPESIVQTTSVSTLKTSRFSNDSGSFSYNNLKENLFFGFSNLPFNGDKTILIATPEKALLDLLYLYPFYKTESDFLELRIDEEMIHDVINKNLFLEFLNKFKSNTLEYRTKLFLKYLNI